MKALVILVNAVTTLAVLVILASAARSQPQGVCGTRAEILGFLAKQYGEQPVASGLSKTGKLIEVLASQDGATWTITMSNTQGITCAKSAGTDWSPGNPRYGEPG